MKLIATLLLLALGCASHAAYWGVAGDFADMDPAASARIAPELARWGTNAVLLNMRGSERGSFVWLKTQKAWEGARHSVFWDAPSTLLECDRIRGFGDQPMTMDGKPLDRGVSFLSPRWASEVQRTAAEMAFRNRSTAGYRVAAPIDTDSLDSDPDAVKSWRRFLAAFFADKSPAHDSNADTAIFNSAYKTDYQSWDQVPLFREPCSRDQRRLTDLWLEKTQADYVNDTCGTLTPLTRGGLNGAAVAGLRSAGSDSSVLASRKFVKRLYASGEAAIPALDSVAAVFGKRVFAAPLKLNPRDLSASRTRLLKLLPYLDGAFFDFSTVARLNDKNEIVDFDPASGVISDLAPFAGRLLVNRANVLWILPPDMPSDRILDAHCVSEDAFALDPNCVDLSKFQAVIYLNSTPCISNMILQRLFDYAVDGGTVFLDAHHVGQGVTLHGRDNGRHWWLDLEVKRAQPGDGSTDVKLGDLMWKIPRVLPYLAATPGKFAEIGQVTDSTGATYPLLLVRKMGKSGKWVFINVPEAEFPLLRAIVADQSALSLPDASRARVYTGPACALAIGGSESQAVSIPCSFGEAVAFDVASHTAFVAAPKDGLLPVPDNIKPGEARLWVVKPCDKPVLLYTGGFPGVAALIDDGAFDGKTLKFKLARRAFVYSPSRPRSLTVGGADLPFDYDPSKRIVTASNPAPGDVADAALTYD